VTESMSSGSIVVATAADANFAKQLAVLVTSLGDRMPQTECTVFVLEDGFSAQDMDRVAQSVGANVALEWISASNADTRSARLPKFLSAATTFRLRLPELLPASLERITYLDADLLIRRPIAELVAAPLDDALVGAVRDPASPWASMSLPWRALGADPAAPYFNAGVLNIPLARWREEQIGSRAFELLLHHDLRWGDNCALNAVMQRRWVELEPEWNLQSGHLNERKPIWAIFDRATLDAAGEDPAIVHFNHPPKNRPWNDPCVSPFAAEWLEVLDRTAWAGWRPDGAGRPRGGSRRLKKTIHRALHG
jgi:lipopolysaccharide biosynthesis glycosyltransferase